MKLKPKKPVLVVKLDMIIYLLVPGKESKEDATAMMELPLIIINVPSEVIADSSHLNHPDKSLTGRKILLKKSSHSAIRKILNGADKFNAHHPKLNVLQIFARLDLRIIFVPSIPLIVPKDGD